MLRVSLTAVALQSAAYGANGVYTKFTPKIVIFCRYDELPARFGLVSFRKNERGRVSVGFQASVAGSLILRIEFWAFMAHALKPT
jgi:hypothetical protein